MIEIHRTDVVRLIQTGLDKIGPKDGEWTHDMVTWDFDRAFLRERGISFPPIAGPGRQLVRDSRLETVFETTIVKNIDELSIGEQKAHFEKWFAWMTEVVEGVEAIPQIVDKAKGLVRWPHSFQLKIENDHTNYSVRLISMTRRLRDDVAQFCLSA